MTVHLANADTVTYVIWYHHHTSYDPLVSVPNYIPLIVTSSLGNSVSSARRTTIVRLWRADELNPSCLTLSAFAQVHSTMLLKTGHLDPLQFAVVACALAVVCAAPVHHNSAAQNSDAIPFITTAIPFQTDAGVSPRLLRRSRRSEAASAKLWYSGGMICLLIAGGLLFWHLGGYRWLRYKMSRGRNVKASRSDNDSDSSCEDDTSSPPRSAWTRLTGAISASIPFMKKGNEPVQSSSHRPTPKPKHRFKKTLRAKAPGETLRATLRN